MDLYRIICPYCHVVHDPREYYADGFHAIVCRGCNKPFVNQTTMTPVFHSFALVGVESERTLPTMEEIEEAIHEDPEQILCVDCGKPVSPDSDWRLCEDCLKDDGPENQQLPISTNSVFLQCPNAPNSLYRLDGDYVEVKYKKGSVIRTTWSDIHMMCEEENPTLTIKELLGTDNTNKVAAMNAFVRAVKGGLIEVDA